MTPVVEKIGGEFYGQTVRFGVWVLLAIAIIKSGIDNVREALGYGNGRPWDSVWDYIFGVGLWLIASFLGVALIQWFLGFLDRKVWRVGAGG